MHTKYCKRRTVSILLNGNENKTEYVVSQIRDNVYTEGQKLLSFKSMADKYKVSMITIRSAIDKLRAEGLLRSVIVERDSVREL